MTKRNIIKSIQSVQCTDLDEYTQNLLCLELITLHYLLNDSVSQLIDTPPIDLNAINSQLSEDLCLNQKDFELVFSTVIYYSSLINPDVTKYIKAISHHLHYYSTYYDDEFCLYEAFYSLLHNIQQQRPEKLKHFTPIEIVNLMSEMAQPRKGESFFDPACGSGEFISSMLKNKANVFGSENHTEDLKLAKIAMLVEGQPTSNITQTLFEEKESHKEKVDIVLTNPPFSMKMPEHANPRFYIYGEPPASNADFAFLQQCIFKLNDNGRTSIIVPEGVLFRGGKEQTIRKEIINHNHISAIIFLPKNTFKNTAIATSIMFLHKKRETSDILLIDSRDKEKFNIDLIINLFQSRKESNFSRLVSLDEVVKNDYNLSAHLYFKNKKNILNMDELIKKQKTLELKLKSLQEEFQVQLSQMHINS